MADMTRQRSIRRVHADMRGLSTERVEAMRHTTCGP